MKRTYILPLLIFSSSMMIFGCTRKHEEVDLSGIHSSQANETFAPSTAPAVEVTSTAETQESTEASKVQDASSNVSAKIETYRDTSAGSISIQYPVVSNLSDEQTQTAVNELLFTNATAIATQYSPEDAVTLDITCQIISVDRNRLVAVYKGMAQTEGGAHPTNIFYTNTVDLKQVKSLGFNDYSDAYTMAGYLMSDDVQFSHATNTQEILNFRSTMSVEQYTEMFNQADFPLSSTEDAIFPESFSYTHQGILYFSIPVPHALGDYAIVTFNIDGK